MALKLAPGVGIEPTTNRLTGDRSTAELPRNFIPKDSSAEPLVTSIFLLKNLATPTRHLRACAFEILYVFQLPRNLFNSQKNFYHSSRN